MMFKRVKPLDNSTFMNLTEIIINSISKLFYIGNFESYRGM